MFSSSLSRSSSPGNQSFSESFNESQFAADAGISARDESIKPALGSLWATVPHHKVLMNFIDNPHDFERDLDGIDREISLFRSKYAAPTAPKAIKITDTGVC
jgi:hypothetical protein